MKSFLKDKALKRVLILGFVSLTLQSCFVAKEYNRPELKEIKNLYRTDNLPKDSLSMATVSWKTLFSDAQLKQYITEGLQNNIDIRIAIEQMAKANAYLLQGKAGNLPSLSINASATHNENSINAGSAVATSNKLNLSGNLSWEADIWGKIRSNKRAYQAGFLQSVAAHQAVKTILVANIASTYYQLMALDDQLTITKKSIINREHSVQTIKALKEAGQVTQVAVDQNIAQYNNARALQVDIETAIFKTENAFAFLLGKTPQHFKRNTLDVQSFSTDLNTGFAASLLRNRPDVMAAEYGLINSFELTNVAESNFYPSLTITAGAGLQSSNLSNWMSANSLFSNFVGGITQPIFNQRKIRTQRDVAKAQQQQALLSFKKTLLQAGNQVSNALYTYKAESKKYEFRQNEVTALRNAEKNSEALLKNGFANYLDLLTARQSALNAELNTIDSKLQQLLSVVNLYEALGGGWR